MKIVTKSLLCSVKIHKYKDISKEDYQAMGKYLKCQTGNNSLKSTLSILNCEIVLYTQNAAYFVSS